MGRMVVGYDVIQDELEKHIPEGWVIKDAMELSGGGCHECDPEGVMSYFVIMFEDDKGNARLATFIHSYRGGSLDYKDSCFYYSGD